MRAQFESCLEMYESCDIGWMNLELQQHQMLDIQKSKIKEKEK